MNLVNLLNRVFITQSGNLRTKLPKKKALFELRITLPICLFQRFSYSDKGIPFFKCSEITCPAILPPIIAIVIPAPLEGRTIPAESPTKT